MKPIEIASLRPPGGGSPRFEGFEHGVGTSFFVVDSLPGRGADRHRHPYAEIFVILAGDLELIVDGQVLRLGGGHIAVIPPDTWHEFKNRGDHPAQMVNIHPVPRMVQEDWEPV